MHQRYKHSIKNELTFLVKNDTIFLHTRRTETNLIEPSTLHYAIEVVKHSESSVNLLGVPWNHLRERAARSYNSTGLHLQCTSYMGVILRG